MRLILRFFLFATSLGLLLILILNHILRDLWHQYSATEYITAAVKQPFSPDITTYDPSNDASSKEDSASLDRVIVMARTTKEDTSWVSKELSDWRNAIYTVDALPASAPDVAPDMASSGPMTPANKGHEAMAYLSYIIDNYASLPQLIAFLHPHRSGFLSAWHTDTVLHSNVDALRTLNTSFVLENGYVNLRCNWSPGCRPSDRDNAHVTEQIWSRVFERTSTPAKSFPFPGEVGQACCAQFAVSREAVTKRPKMDYKMMRNWLINTELSDRKSGRVFEFLWHVIFGMGHVYCPDEKECYCHVYGRC